MEARRESSSPLGAAGITGSDARECAPCSRSCAPPFLGARALAGRAAGRRAAGCSVTRRVSEAGLTACRVAFRDAQRQPSCVP
eukprot:scaffold48842_cov55-Phaeocystis_antarctica.AAC.3